MADIQDCFFPEQRVLDVLGKTREELFEMGLRDLAKLAFEKGLVFEVRPDGGVAPGLTISIEDEERVAL